MKKNKLLISLVCLTAAVQIFPYTLHTDASKQTDYSSVSQESIENAIDDLQDAKNNNNDKIDELQKEIEKSQELMKKSQDNEEAKISYQKALEEKMNLQQENILYIEKQISTLESDIDEHISNISILENQISEKQTDIDIGIEDFKSRLRAMYISGNTSYASILTGSTSFYDLLSRIELIKRVSERDNETIDNLQQQLSSLNEDKATLENENTVLNSQMDELNERKSEYSATLESLSSNYQETQDEINRIALEQQQLQLQQSEKSEQLKTMEEEQQKIQDEIIKAQAERKRIQKEKEEEEKRRKQEEEESKRQEALASVTTAPSEPSSPSVTTAVTTESPSNNTIYSGGSMTWPVPGHYIITDYYGKRTWAGSGFHYGLDLGGGNIGGSSIVAAESGTVILAVNYCTHNYAKYSSCGCGGGFGNYVVIDHGGTYATLYGHCESINVSVGDYVTKGQTIGKVGTTGYSTGYHLHFEVRKNGERVNPLDYLSY